MAATTTGAAQAEAKKPLVSETSRRRLPAKPMRKESAAPAVRSLEKVTRNLTDARIP
jgi:hypothetical protein